MRTKVMHHLKSWSDPTVKIIGSNPDDWEIDLPMEMDRGARYAVFKSKADARSPKDTVTWVKDEEVLPEDEASFVITGSFNDWDEDDFMDEGDVPGLKTTIVTVPESGMLEFRFLMNGIIDNVFAPETDHCTRKLTPIIGPEPDLKNCWTLLGEPDSDFQIELFVRKGKRSILWFPRKL